MQILSQNDTRWKNKILGTGNTTIGNYGCTITSLSMILGVTPDVMNQKLLAVNGYAESSPGVKNLVIWAKIAEAFPGTQVRRVYSYNNDDVKANVPNVLVEVDGKPIGGYRHWVVYVGGGKLYDPWDGKEGPTSEYPSPVSYCVVIPPVQQPVATIPQDELDKVRKERDDNWNLYQKEMETNKNLNTQINDKNRELDTLRKDNEKLAVELKECQIQVDDKTDLINGLNGDMEKLKNQMVQASTDVTNARNESETLRRSNAQLRSLLDKEKPKTFADKLKFLFT